MAFKKIGVAEGTTLGVVKTPSSGGGVTSPAPATVLTPVEPKAK